MLTAEYWNDPIIKPDNEHGKALLDYASSGGDGTSYDIVTLSEGNLHTTQYRSRPCFGEMRPYQKTHPEEVKDGVGMPGDLNRRFPDGNPVGYSTPKISYAGNPAMQFLVDSGESPFRSVYGLATKARDKNGEVIGFAFLDTRFDPTLLVNSLITGRYLNGPVFDSITKIGGTGTEAFILSMVGYGWDCYAFTSHSNLRRILEGDPVNNSGNAETFFERAVYNRPKNEYSFVDGKNSIHKLLSEFKKSWSQMKPEVRLEALRSSYQHLE